MRRRKLIDYFFPRYCFGCQEEGKYVCQKCTYELIPHPDQCPFCHRAMLFGQICYDCFPQHRHLRGIMIAFVYTTVIKKLILGLKFYHQYDIASFLGQKLSLLIQTNPSLIKAYKNKSLIVSYVPSHRRRHHFVKGYNQSFLLATEVAKNLDVPCIQIGKKIKHTASQTRLSKQKRLNNLTNVFSIHAGEKINHKTIIIIDDITTTGATIDTLAAQLKKRYPTCTIRGVVVGRHGR